MADGTLRTAGAHVVAVNTSAVHDFSKTPQQRIDLLEGLGVEGDAHCGATVKHRSRVRRDPTQPNLRQVHLLGAELFDELAQHGHPLRAGDLGENITTSGVDLHALPRGTVLRIGAVAEVELTGLRNPCWQIDAFSRGLLGHVLRVGEDGQAVRRAGVMGVVRRGGPVCPGDPLSAVLPDPPHHALERV